MWGKKEVKTFNIYASVSDCLAACDKAWNEGRRCGFINGLHSDNRAYWIGRKFGSWPNILAAVTSYWQEGLDAVEGMLYEIDKLKHTLPPPTDRRRRRVWSPDDGDDLDLDRLRSGQDYWQKCQRVTTRAPKPVTLVSDLLTASTVASQDILWRGATSIVLSDVLEKAGYRVDLWGCECSEPYGLSNDRVFQAVKIKDMSQPVDISNVVNCVSGWFYRTVFGFQAFHVPIKEPNSTYGSGKIPWMADHPELVDRLTLPNAMVVKVDDIWSLKAALAKVTEVILELNKETTNA